MCGLAGVLSVNKHLNHQEKNSLIELGFLISLRGVDSTGMVMVRKKKPRSPKIDYEIRKAPVNPVTFFTDREVRQEIGHNHNVCIMLHSRAATNGDINTHNAHPMVEENLIGMHNGVVNKHKVHLKAEQEYMTDSRGLYQAIAKKGLTEALRELYIGDAYALNWIDRKTNTINFIRNDKRPLHFVHTEEGPIFWCSEVRLLELALGRNLMKITKHVELVPGKLFYYDFATGEYDNVELELEKPAPPKIKVQADIGGTFLGSKASTVLPSERLRAIDETAFKDVEAFLKEMKELGDVEEVKENKVVPLLAPPRNDNIAPPDSKYAYYKYREFGKPSWASLPRAKAYLERGCHNCRGKRTIYDTVHWQSPSLYICDECIDLDIVKDNLDTHSLVMSEIFDDGGKRHHA